MTCHRLGRRDLVSIHSFTSAQLAGLHFSLFSSCGGWKHRITTFSLYFEQLGLSARACLDLPSFGVKMSKARNAEEMQQINTHVQFLLPASVSLTAACLYLCFWECVVFLRGNSCFEGMRNGLRITYSLHRYMLSDLPLPNRPYILMVYAAMNSPKAKSIDEVRSLGVH